MSLTGDSGKSSQAAVSSRGGVALSPRYYLDNFILLLRGVSDRYGDLLNDSESAFIHDFYALSTAAQCLLVRLMSRKGPWFCRQKLAYAEIPDLDRAVELLRRSEFIHHEPVDNEWLLTHLTKAELAQLLSQWASSTEHTVDDKTLQAARLNKLRKAELSRLIREHLFVDKQSFQLADNLDDYWFILSRSDIAARLIWLYFERMDQDLSQFILVDLGVQKFESYSVKNTNRCFKSREQKDAFLAICTVNHEVSVCDFALIGIDDGLKVLDGLSERVAQLTTDDNERLSRMVQRLRLVLGRQYERFGQYRCALKQYTHCQLAPSRERQARCLDKLGDADAAHIITRQMCRNSLDASEPLVAARMQKALHRKLGLPKPEAPQLQYQVEHRQIIKAEAGVEQSTADSFNQGNLVCYVVENRLFCSLFSLAFWDIIFADVNDVFANPYQIGPNDMYHSEFYSRRRAAIRARLAELAKGDFAIIWLHLHQKFGISNDWVYWPLFANDSTSVTLAPEAADSQLLSLALRAFSPQMIVDLFSKMLFDLRFYRCGFPDLICFNHLEIDDELGVKLIEVKGPGDSLRDSQMLWLDWFNRQGVDASVCYVDWQTQEGKD